MMNNIAIKFALWNTGLNPPGNNREHLEGNYDILNGVIDCFLNEYSVDFLALLEVSAQDCSFLNEKFSGQNVVVVNAVEQGGVNLYFDLCLIYNKEKIRILSRDKILVPYSGRNYKAAQKITLQLFDGEIVHVFISHWPSRILAEPTEATRSIIGNAIKNSIREIESDSEKLPYIILMGDYNAEPYSDCIQMSLGGTRDPDLVSRNPNLLYNPFWHFLHHPGETEVKGSHYYAGGYQNKWVVFDQMLFSSAFLFDRKGWYYNIGESAISPHNLLAGEVGSRSVFDHYPVISIIRKDFS